MSTVTPSSPVLPGGYGAVAQREQIRLLPMWGMLLAAALIVSRRPDAITHAQFWAEDGHLYYADVYNHGLLATLLVPQAGYFQVLPTLAAGIAQLVPLAFAPLVTNTIAIVIRVLPVGLLLSQRAVRISADIRVRALLAALYIALPGAPETDGNIVNALWYLAIAAVIVLMLSPPVRRSARILDLTIVTLCSLTGPFCIALAPLALLYRRWRGRDAVSRTVIAILAVGAAIQLAAIFVLEYHLPSGFGAMRRPSVPLHASAERFFQILGLRVIAEQVLGSSVTLSAVLAALLGLLATLGALIAFRRASPELKLMVAFGGVLFVMALARPLGAGWPGLLVFPEGSRYFLIPQLAAAATLIWAIGYTRHGLPCIVLTGILVYTCLITIPRNWTYPAFKETYFAQQASIFEHERLGSRTIFQLEPPGWSMTLVKH